ncbi:hypothetical protein HPP92_014039 [Vanilla planifolia]|uniref:CN hydrolase domain-containing protein n=1 Tax=Vanilla planifolia TaxID=51239 RepID=A0A835UUE5_VANPL|nr:hypothetical protein HPP92_014039 [Vanilla planifolia]
MLFDTLGMLGLSDGFLVDCRLSNTLGPRPEGSLIEERKNMASFVSSNLAEKGNGEAASESVLSPLVPDGSIHGFESLHQLLETSLKPELFQEVSRLLLGFNCGKAIERVLLPEIATSLSIKHDFDIQAFCFHADKEALRQPRIVRVGLIQNKIVLPTTAPFSDQKKAIMQKVKLMIDAAGASGVNIICLQFLQGLAREYNMVIVNPILERDLKHGEVLSNTAVIIGNHGNIIGIHRKNHIPRVGDFNESTYYMEGNTGHPVFETCYGKIAVNICYGRHHPLNWLAFGLNGAEIVFNPSATVGELSEPMWPIEARNAAIANSYFVGSINRVGTETFPNPFTSGDGKPQHSDFGHFYGSSYFSAPDASCTPSLSRHRDGLLISDMDLNLCRQLKDKWGFRMTARYEIYGDLLSSYLKPSFTPQVILDPSLQKR